MAAGLGSLENPAQQDYEQRLIQRIRDGEHEAFYQLIRPYERRVYAAAFAILHNETDAEDCAQEAVLKAFRHIRQFRAEARFSTWLIQIASTRRVCEEEKNAPISLSPSTRRAARKAPTCRATSPTGVRFPPRSWSGKKSEKS